MYFKTSGGNWVAASEDEDGRLFMIDEIGDLYYDSGEPDIGLYAVSGWGSLPLLYAVGGWGSLHSNSGFIDLPVTIQPISCPPSDGYARQSVQFLPRH